MAWLWYLLVVLGVLFALFAYRTQRAIRRMNADDTGPFSRVLATQFGVTAAASLALGIVLAFTIRADPGTTILRRNLADDQLALHSAMGHVLGAEIAKVARPGARALVVSRKLEDSENPNTQAIFRALEEEFGNQVKISRHHTLELEPGLEGIQLERAASRSLTLSASDLDRLAEQNPDCNVIICLVDVDAGYANSAVASRVAAGQAIFGLYSKNPYLLGGAISSGQITCAVIPKRNAVHDFLPPNTTPRERFDQRFFLVNHENIREVWNLNKRLFYVIQRPN